MLADEMFQVIEFRFEATSAVPKHDPTWTRHSVIIREEKIIIKNRYILWSIVGLLLNENVEGKLN